MSEGVVAEQAKVVEQKPKLTWTMLVSAWFMLQMDGYKKWRANRRFLRNQRLFYTLIKDKRSGLEDVCRKHAELMARQMCMSWLDTRRPPQAHCRFCHGTDELRMWGNGPGRYYVCEPHFDALKGGAKVVSVPTGNETNGVRP
jgi:hypothetical protein